MKISLPVYFLLFWNTLAWSWRISLSLFLSLLLHFTRIGKTRHKRQYSPALSQRSRHLKNPFPSSLMLTFVCTHTHTLGHLCVCANSAEHQTLREIRFTLAFGKSRYRPRPSVRQLVSIWSRPDIRFILLTETETELLAQDIKYFCQIICLSQGCQV